MKYHIVPKYSNSHYTLAVSQTTKNPNVSPTPTLTPTPATPMGQDQSSFPYTLSSTSLTTFPTGWTLHQGTRKTDNLKVSVWTLDKKSGGKSRLAENFGVLTKKIRHPNTLTVIDQYEDEKSNYLVTKRVVPLRQMLDGIQESVLTWGVYQVLVWLLGFMVMFFSKLLLF